MQGQLDISLDDVGRGQAAAAAVRLGALEPAVLLSSDLVRAHDTAQALSAAAGLPVVTDPRLRELYLGTWQGLTGAEAAVQDPDEHAAWRAGRDVARGGGETYRDAAERAVACLQDHLPALGAGQVLIAVTHGGTARAALGLLLELPPASWGRLAPLGNACWSVLIEAEWGWRLERHGAQAR